MSFAIATALFLIALALALYSRPRAALLVIFLAPWQGLDVDVGLRLSAYLVVLSAMLAIFTLQWSLNSRGPRIRSSAALPVGIVVYAVIWSALQIPFLPDMEVQGGALRSSTMRAVSQIFMFILTISPIFLIPTVVRSTQDCFLMARTYLVSVSVLAGIGWLQLTIWAQTGSDPLPVGFVNSLLGGAGEERSGITTFYDESIYRMSSFGGEPKGLGSSLAVALLLLQSGFNVWRQRLILWAFLFCSLIATLSTMGIMIWFAGTAIQMIAPAPLSARIPKISLRLRRSVFVLGTLLVLSIGWGLLSTEKGAWLVELIEFRTVTRISERAESGGSWVSGAMEDFNVAVYGFLADKPVHSIFGVGVGNAHLYANSYLPDYAKAHAEGTAFVAKSSLLRWTSELGIVSFLAFLIWLLLLARNLIRAFRPIGLGDSARGAIGRFFIPVTLIWLASGYITPQFYLMLGTIIGLIYVAEATEQRTTFSSPVGPSIRPTKA